MMDFKSFEHHGWQHSAQEYTRSFGPLTEQALESMLDALDARAGRSLLDVACGAGALAASAAARGVAATGLDFSSEMVERAARVHPRVSFRAGDAEALPFADESFDCVGMNFGMLHLGDPEAAMRETARVLRSGGRFAFTVWAPPQLETGFKIILEAIAAHGSAAVVLPSGPPFFHFSDASNAQRALSSAGFADVRRAEIFLRWELPSAEAFFTAFAEGTARTGGLLRAQPPEALAAIRDAVSRAVNERYRTDAGVCIPMPAVLYSASSA